MAIDHFNYINPCGLGEGTVTSLAALLGDECDYQTEVEGIIRSFCKMFDKEYNKVTLDQLLGSK